MEMGHRGETKLNYENEYNYSFAYILQHPINTATIFFRTFYKNAFLWTEQVVGSHLSGMTLLLPAWLTTAFMFVIFMATFNTPQQTVSLKKRDRTVLVLIILGIVGLVMASMFVGWTSNTSPTIQGVQGRYFTPLLPLIALAVSGSLFTTKRNIDRELTLLSVFLTVASLSTVLEYTVAH